MKVKPDKTRKQALKGTSIKSLFDVNNTRKKLVSGSSGDTVLTPSELRWYKDNLQVEDSEVYHLSRPQLVLTAATGGSCGIPSACWTSYQ